MRNLNEVREALLNSTVRIVAQYGLERTTTKLIAADAQINEAYIYRCYDSKDSLLQATFHMEDVCLAEHVRKSLPVMRIRGLNWKERCFLLWKSCWEFILHKPDDCRFYLQYYYSVSCRRHAYDEHLKYFHSLFDEIRPVFRPDTNVDMLLHQIFDTMLSFAAEYCLMRSRTAKIQRNGLLSRCTVSSAPMQEKIGWRQLKVKRN